MSIVFEEIENDDLNKKEKIFIGIHIKKTGEYLLVTKTIPVLSIIAMTQDSDFIIDKKTAVEECMFSDRIKITWKRMTNLDGRICQSRNEILRKLDTLINNGWKLESFNLS